MPSNNFIEIRRKGRKIGFLESGQIPQAEKSLPGMEGASRGLAIVAEIENEPIGAVIFPWAADYIDISNAIPWSPRADENQPFDDVRGEAYFKSFKENPSLIEFSGELIPGRREAFDFEGDYEYTDFDLVLNTSSISQDSGIRLEIEEEREPNQFLHLRFNSEARPGQLFFRTRAYTRTQRSESGGEMRFNFFVEGLPGFSPRLRWAARFRTTNDRRGGEFNFRFDSFGRNLAYGSGVFVGETAVDSPFVLLFESIFRQIKTVDKPTSFRLWIGAVRYGSASDRALLQLKSIAQRAETLSGNEVAQVATWLASAANQIETLTFARAISPLLDRLRPVQELLRPPPPNFRIQGLNLKFDGSVSPEKKILFLKALAQHVSQAGGRLCFAPPEESSP